MHRTFKMTAIRHVRDVDEHPDRMRQHAHEASLGSGSGGGTPTPTPTSANSIGVVV